MNLKDFKKVHEDDQKAILQNKKGHSFTIAKKALSKNHLENLKNLPLYSAEGNVVPDQVEDEAMPQQAQERSPAQEAPEQQPTMAQEAPPPEVQPPEAPQTSPMADTEQPQQHGYAQQPEYKKSYDDFFNENLKELGDSDAAYLQDMRNQHITPKTYKQVSGERALGRVGTAFALLLGGIGSGLTGQKNAALEMMDKEIQRDYDAQVQSKSNAQNLYKINMASELNKAQVKNLSADIALKVQTQTLNQMTIDKLHDLSTMVNSIPDNSPQKPLYNAGMDEVTKAAQAKIQQRNQETAAKAAAITHQKYLKDTEAWRTAGFGSNSAAGQAGKMADMRDARMVGNMGYTDGDVTTDQKESVGKLQGFQNLLNEYRDNLQKSYSFADKIKKDPKSITEALPTLNRMKQIRADLLTSYNDIKGFPRFTSNEEGLYKQVFPEIDISKPLDALKTVSGVPLDAVKRNQEAINRHRDTFYKSIGYHSFADEGGKSSKSAPKQSSSAQGATKSAGVIPRVDPATGKTHYYDAKTKKPVSAPGTK